MARYKVGKLHTTPLELRELVKLPCLHRCQLPVRLVHPFQFPFEQDSGATCSDSGFHSRNFTVKQAKSISVTGYVQNASDGTVSIHIS